LKDRIRFYQASTSEIYGDNDNIPQNENTICIPNSPYAVAKLYAYHITNSYKTAYNIFSCNGILFNHESPRRGHNFITRKITRAVASIKYKKQECLYLGNLDSKRDWGHAKDYVYGMWLMLQQQKPDNYVLSTGQQHTVRYFVERAFRIIDIDIIWEGSGLNEVGLDRVSKQIYVRVSQKYFRPNEVGNLLGDSTKAREKLGWNHTYDFDDIVQEMVQFDLECEFKETNIV
jgi:GDPmannose 4,6-dehydratase